MKRLALAATGGLLALGLWAGLAYRHARLRTTLVEDYADALPAEPALHAYATSLAQAAFVANCAACHGDVLKGDLHQSDARHGVPDLRRGAWLYDIGRASDIERTLLYGIRAGNAKGRNTTDMPAFGVTHRLTPAEIDDVSSYVLSLSRTGMEAGAVARGAALYQGKGECFDCHGADATGNIDWGVPRLTGGDWLYGGTRADIAASIHDGRHGRCPAWIGVLDPVTIRALAVMLHGTARGQPGA